MFLSIPDSVMNSQINSLLKSHIEEIDILADLNVLFDRQIYFAVVNNIFFWLNKCVK